MKLTINYTRHAIQRMAERGIKADEVEEVLQTGTILHEYAEDKPLPSILSLGFPDNKPLHVVYSCIEVADERVHYVITVYRPEPSEWDGSFRMRRYVK